MSFKNIGPLDFNPYCPKCFSKDVRVHQYVDSTPMHVKGEKKPFAYNCGPVMRELECHNCGHKEVKEIAPGKIVDS